MAPKKSKKSSSDTNSSSTISFEVCNTSLPQTIPGEVYQTNPHQVYGTRNAFEAKTVEEGFYVRIDMPGVRKDTVEVNFENKKLSFSGKEPELSPHEFGRDYRGEITFSLEPLEVSEFKTDMNNGVLRVVLVGSGFPKNYIAASSHSSSESPEVTPPTCGFITGCASMLKLKRFKVLDPPLEMYPFQWDGAMGLCRMQGLNGGCGFERIDMPDVDSRGLTLTMSDNKIVYGGDGVKGSEYDESNRLYFREFLLECPCCHFVDMRGEIIDGVLRVFIRKERVIAT